MTTRPEWILLPEEGRVRGFKSTLAFRRWCKSHGVHIRKDGKRQWVKPSDVDIAITGPSQPANDAVTHAVAAIMGRN